MSGSHPPRTPTSECGSLEYVLNRIDDLYDTQHSQVVLQTLNEVDAVRKSKVQKVCLFQYQVSKAIHKSIVSVGFVETSLGPDHSSDEVLLDLGSDHKFPPNLFIASRFDTTIELRKCGVCRQKKHWSKEKN